MKVSLDVFGWTLIALCVFLICSFALSEGQALQLSSDSPQVERCRLGWGSFEVV